MSITGRYITMRGGNIIGTPPVIVPPSLLLDLYPNAAAAYSLRKLRSAYTGACIRVRRSSDNAEQDIGFVANELDTAALLAFVGSGNGLIVTWYDQQGSNNLTNSTLIRQPIIVSSGVLQLSGGMSSIFMNKNVHFLTSTLSNLVALPVSIFGAVETISLSTNAFGNVSFLVNGSTGGFQGRYEITASNTNYNLQRRNNSGTATAKALDAWTPKRTLITALFASSDLSGRQDGNVYAGVSYSGTPFSPGSSFYQLNHNIALNSTQLGIDAKYMEVIIYHNDQTANAAAIEDNINNYYGIY
jgi:hypothetical protein